MWISRRKIRDLTEDEVNRIRTVIEQEGRVEGDLRKEIQMNISPADRSAGVPRIRHRRNLPVRGQRTHTNARTRKGPTARRGCRQETDQGQEGLAETVFSCQFSVLSRKASLLEL